MCNISNLHEVYAEQFRNSCSGLLPDHLKILDRARNKEKLDELDERWATDFSRDIINKAEKQFDQKNLIKNKK